MRVDIDNTWPEIRKGLPKAIIDSLDRSRDARLIGNGMAIAAQTVISAFGNHTIAREILSAAGYTTLDSLYADGVDDYDVNYLKDLYDENGNL